MGSSSDTVLPLCGTKEEIHAIGGENSVLFQINMRVNPKWRILRVWQRNMFVMCLQCQQFPCDQWLKVSGGDALMACEPDVMSAAANDTCAKTGVQMRFYETNHPGGFQIQLTDTPENAPLH